MLNCEGHLKNNFHLKKNFVESNGSIGVWGSSWNHRCLLRTFIFESVFNIIISISIIKEKGGFFIHGRSRIVVLALSLNFFSSKRHCSSTLSLSLSLSLCLSLSLSFSLSLKQMEKSPQNPWCCSLDPGAWASHQWSTICWVCRTLLTSYTRVNCHLCFLSSGFRY